MKNNAFPDDYDEKPWVYDFSDNLDGIIKSRTRLKMRLFWFATIIVNSFFTIPKGFNIKILNSHLLVLNIMSEGGNNIISNRNFTVPVYRT